MNLEQLPEILQNEVKKYLERSEGAKVLDVEVRESTPYKDKTITDTNYKVFLEYANVLSVFTYRICSKPEWNSHNVYRDSMIAGDIDVFIKKSRWFRNWEESN